MASGPYPTIPLRRRDTGKPWGFRMQGGREFQGLPLFIAQVNPKGIAGKAGLQSGDVVMMICGKSVVGFSHQEAKAEMIRAGNELDLTVDKGAIDPKHPDVLAATGQEETPRSELDEGSINPGMNEGTKFRNVTPKTYKILQQQLGDDEPPPSALAKEPPKQMAPVHAQAKPSSIFDRNKQERSGYLQAQGNTIQKAYGEQ